MQIVGYRAGVDGPADLLLAADGDVQREPLVPGEHLSLALGERHCAGQIEADRHEACEASGAPYCDVHASAWPCARCTGNCELPLDACRESHAIYLAAFAPSLFKVGVTREWRLATRLREQGADRAAHVRTVVNGRVAREIEAEMARDLTDRVRVPTKVGGLDRRVDPEAWNDLLDEFDPIETFDFDYGLDLACQPVAETLATGTVVGTKGRILVLECEGTTYAVDMRDLVGHEVGEGAPARERQSSLGAFD